MWVSHVRIPRVWNPLYVVLMLQLLCILQETVIYVRAQYTCEVGQERTPDNQWRWVLPYEHPCKCSRIRFGGTNIDTPKRPFEPIYVEKPLVGENLGEIRDHYGLNCIELTCPANGSIEEVTDPGQAKSPVIWEAKATGNGNECLQVECAPPSGLNYSIGTKNITCKTKDEKGNSRSCVFQVSVIDKEMPAITTCEDQETAANPEQAFATDAYKIPNATDNSKVEPNVDCAPPPESEFPMGETTVTCEARDKSSNMATCDFQVIVKDQTAPAVSCPAAITTNTETVSWTNTDPPSATDNVDGTIPTNQISCSPSLDSSFAVDQSTTVICTATDTAGNSGTCMFTVIVDDESPVIDPTCSDDIEAVTEEGQTIAVVEYNVPSATDNSGNTPSVECTPPSGFDFQLGVTTVSCSARDSSNNIGRCNFQVYINVTQLGCFIDNKNRALPNLYMQDAGMTRGFCTEHCRANQQRYAAVQSENQCFCGNLDDNYATYGKANEEACHRRCSGDDSQTCGGTWHQNVFDLKACEIGWRPFRRSCYKKHTDAVNFENAEASCIGGGGHLASIHSESEQKFIDDMMTKDVPEIQYWIGFNDRQTEGTFVWTDQSDQDQYTEWAKNQPDTGTAGEGEDCVMVDNIYSKGWHDLSCTEQRIYTCKKEMN